MRALVFDGPLALRVEERPDPTPAPGEVRLRVEAVGICGSDLHGYTGETGRRAPGMVMGHEIGAVVEETGEVVAVHPVLFCGECAACREGRTEMCASVRVIGVTPTLQGGFADYICVPARNAIEMGGADPEHAALVEPLAVAIHAVRRGGVRPGDRVFVAGGGMIGLVCMLAAFREGAEEVFLSDLLPHRREVAAALGATALDPAADDVVAAVAEATGGGVERAFDAVGLTPAMDAALRATANDGTIVLVGMGRPKVELDLYAVVVNQRRIVGTFCYSESDFRDAAGWVAGGDQAFDTLIERRVGFHDVASAFHRLAVGEDDAVKALFLTRA